jgi:short-subunit dehydrogenase
LENSYNTAVFHILQAVKFSFYHRQISSIASSGGFASVGMYSTGKAALDAMSEALFIELGGFGIKVTFRSPAATRQICFFKNNNSRRIEYGIQGIAGRSFEIME